MKSKVTIAVSAALMSMTVNAANDLSKNDKQFKIEPLSQADAISINKLKKPASQYKFKETYKAEKHLGIKDYVYIVQLKDNSVATYNGTIEGLEATNPRKAKVLTTGNTNTGKGRLDVKSKAVSSYAAYLEKGQKQFIEQAHANVGQFETIATFKYSLNAIAVKTTPQNAELIAKLPGVKKVERDQIHRLDTDSGPTLIGAPKIWDGSAVDNGLEQKGEGIVVAALDTGINSDHKSFADIGGDNYDHTNPLGANNYLGDCAGDFPEMCNDKLIGVYSYPDIVSAYSDTTIFPEDLPQNGEDYNGHGSHTASTAAGNFLYNVPEVSAELGEDESDGIPTGFEYDRISGVAPHANIIAYQVCQPGETGDTYSGCFTTPMVSAIEDAIASGIVDVINFSISGGGYPWSGSLNAAWLSARNAGIFVAQSAGNDGPDPFTTSKHSPWITAVAAATHGRSVEYDKFLTDFTGGQSELQNIPGKSNSGGITASIVYAGDYENPNDPDSDPAQCLEPFPDGTFSGEIVVCDRGEIARVQKAVNVSDGGAGGFVLANIDGGADSLANDVYVIPGIHINAENGNLLRDWLASGTSHSATITASTGQLVIDPAGVDNTADFSSRGPNASISTLTPSVTAPGVNIYAAYSDQQYGHDETGTAPADYAYLSGTSMSSPHVAGAAALVKQVKPEWTPDNIRSALMMTASTDVRKEDGVTVADWFDMGAGRIQVDLAVQSGLVMDEEAQNYSDADPELGGEPRDLNIPSITDNNCVGTCSWKRTVTATKDGSWTVGAMSASEGLNITVTPETFDLTAGESQEITVSIDAFSAQSDVWSFGAVTLTSANSPDLHLPVSIVASNGNLPEKLEFTAHRNQDSYLIRDLMAVEITDLQSKTFGLVKLDTELLELSQDSDNSDFLDDTSDGVSVTEVNVPEGASRIVAETGDSESPDLDLYLVFDANGDGIPQEDEVVAASATATADERVSVLSPQAGKYWIMVQNWAASSPEVSDKFELSYGVVTSDSAHNLEIEAPQAVSQLTPFDIRLIWDLENAEEGDRYTGVVALGTDLENPDNLGFIPVDIVRGEDDVFVSSSVDDRVEPGDIVEFSVNVIPNFTFEDRNYEISVSLPDGVTLNPESVSANATVDGNVITWEHLQPSLQGVEPTYNITSNATDPMCANPDFGQGGGYIDLETFGIGFNAIDGDTVDSTFSLKAAFLGRMYDSITVTDDGFITIGGETGSKPWVNQLMPDTEIPNGLLAPLWRDQLFDVANGSGLSVASAGDAYTIVEWDNMKPYGVGDAYADIADYEVVFSNAAAEGEPNIIFSYNDVVHELGAILPLSIGYENDLGTSGKTVFYTPFMQDSIDGNFNASITSGTQICLYLNDVDTTPTKLSLSVKVSEENTGGPIQLIAMSDVTNIPGTTMVASDIFDDVQVEGSPVIDIEESLEVVELSKLTLPVTISDPNGDAVDILWKQVDGPAAVIAGNGIANAVLIAPEVEEDTTITLEVSAEDENGNRSKKTVSVLVKNNEAPTIQISAPSSVGEGETITISASANDPEGDEIQFTINGVPGSQYSTTAPGTESTTTVDFVVTASDGLNTTTETVSVTVNDKSGGSMGWLVLLLAPVAYLRRKTK